MRKGCVGHGKLLLPPAELLLWRRAAAGGGGDGRLQAAGKHTLMNASAWISCFGIAPPKRSSITVRLISASADMVVCGTSLALHLTARRSPTLCISLTGPKPEARLAAPPAGEAAAE